jgi:hypothetical protein
MSSSFEKESEVNKNDEQDIDILLISESHKRKCDEQCFSSKLLKTCDDTQNEKQKLGRPLTSLIRKYFKIDEKLKIANCELNSCNKIVKNPCTSNLKRHTQTHHLEVFKSVESEELKLKSIKVPSITKQQTLSEFLNKKQKYNESDQKQIDNEKALSYFFTAIRYPYNIIHNSAFRDLLTQFDPKFTIPGATKLTNHAINFEKSMQEKIKDLLLKNNSIALTTDLWTTKYLINSYLCLTAHFYDEDTKAC